VKLVDEPKTKKEDKNKEIVVGAKRLNSLKRPSHVQEIGQ
jgi:hypothetical protein